MSEAPLFFVKYTKTVFITKLISIAAKIVKVKDPVSLKTISAVIADILTRPSACKRHRPIFRIALMARHNKNMRINALRISVIARLQYRYKDENALH